jgi:siroheme synthase
VFLMGVSALPRIVAAMRDGGLAEDTPVAIVEQGARDTQRTTIGTLTDIAELAVERGVRSPAIIIIGQVVALRDRLGLEGEELEAFAAQFEHEQALAPRAALG